MEKSNFKLVDLPKILDERGNLSFIEAEAHLPFKIKRIFWIYDVPGGEVRGGHAYRSMNEFIVALSGSFDVLIDNGEKKVKIHLNRSYHGLFIPKMVWRHMENFSTNSLALVICDKEFNEHDYIRDYDQYIKLLS